MRCCEIKRVKNKNGNDIQHCEIVMAKNVSLNQIRCCEAEKVEYIGQVFGRHLQIMKYACVGVFALIIDWTIFYTLAEVLKVHYIWGATAGFLCGLLTNYTLCIYWVFDNYTNTPSYRQFIIFAAIGVVGLALTDVLMWIFTETIGVNKHESKLVAAVLVFLWNYFARKYCLFVADNTTLGRNFSCRKLRFVSSEPGQQV